MTDLAYSRMRTIIQALTLFSIYDQMDLFVYHIIGINRRGTCKRADINYYLYFISLLATLINLCSSLLMWKREKGEGIIIIKQT